jgi:hypothetical protein
MKEDETPEPSERLTEELQRQDWQERIANLENNLKFVGQEIEDQQLRDLDREMQGLPPRGTPHPSLAHLANELQIGVEPMLKGAPPLFLRLSPEKQEALLEDWRKLNRGLG